MTAERVPVLDIRRFIADRIRDDQAANAALFELRGHAAPDWAVLDAHRRALSALEQITCAHDPESGACLACGDPFPCATLRSVAWTWRHHRDYADD